MPRDTRIAAATMFEYAAKYSADNGLAITQAELSQHFGEIPILSRSYAAEHREYLKARPGVKGPFRFGKHWLTSFLDAHDLSVKAHTGQKIIPFEKLRVDIINWQIKLHLLLLSGRYELRDVINGDEAAHFLYKAPKYSIAPKGESHNVALSSNEKTRVSNFLSAKADGEILPMALMLPSLDSEKMLHIHEYKRKNGKFTSTPTDLLEFIKDDDFFQGTHDFLWHKEALSDLVNAYVNRASAPPSAVSSRRVAPASATSVTSETTSASNMAAPSGTPDGDSVADVGDNVSWDNHDSDADLVDFDDSDDASDFEDGPWQYNCAEDDHDSDSDYDQSPTKKRRTPPKKGKPSKSPGKPVSKLAREAQLKDRLKLKSFHPGGIPEKGKMLHGVSRDPYIQAVMNARNYTEAELETAQEHLARLRAEVQKMWDNMKPMKDEEQVHNEFVVFYNNKGWGSELVTLAWLKHVVLYVQRQDERQILLILDNFSGHVTDRIKAFCLRHNIDLFWVVGNTTGYTQPMDISFNRPYKQYLSGAALLLDDIKNNRGRDEKMPLLEASLISCSTALDEMKVSSVISGFERMVLYSHLSPSERRKIKSSS